MQITTIVNKKTFVLVVASDEMLADALRRNGYLSIRKGCDTSCCGLCTVWVDEKPVLGVLIQTVPAAIALIVEYFLIFRLDAGIIGSAIGAWIITMGSWYILVFHFIFGKTDLKIKLSDIKLKKNVINQINKIGNNAIINAEIK